MTFLPSPNTMLYYTHLNIHFKHNMAAMLHSIYAQHIHTHTYTHTQRCMHIQIKSLSVASNRMPLNFRIRALNRC